MKDRDAKNTEVSEAARAEAKSSMRVKTRIRAGDCEEERPPASNGDSGGPMS